MAAIDWFSYQNCGGSAPGDTEKIATIGCLEPLFISIVQAAAALVGVALFVMLLVGGFNFLFSGGDQKKLEAARGTVTNAIIGLAVIAVAYLIIRTIDVFVFGGAGVVTKFEIPIK